MIALLLLACTGPAPVPDDTARPDPLPPGLHGTPPDDPVPRPDFLAYDHTGAQRGSADLNGHPTVLWFHPGAADPGTAAVAAAYAEEHDGLADLDVQVVAVSFDDVDTLAAWAAESSPPFALWADIDRELASTYGAIPGSWALSPDPTTVLLDDRGALLLQYDDAASDAHPARVRADADALFGR